MARKFWVNTDRNTAVTKAIKDETKSMNKIAEKANSAL